MAGTGGTPWWVEALKIGPGWIAFLTVMIRGILKWKHRGRLLAVGPASDLRQDLYFARRLFTDITAEPRRAKWFEAEERREIDQRLTDLADQVGDRELKVTVQAIASSWKECFACAPPERGPYVSYVGDPQPPQWKADSDEDAARHQQQVDHARVGLTSIKKALTRLNKLERGTIGRS